MLRSDFQPEKLRNERLQQQMEQAFDYRSRITALIRERSDSVLKDELVTMAAQFDNWIEEIYGLAVRLDLYLVDREQLMASSVSAEKRIKQLTRKLEVEDSAAVIADIETNIASMQRQIETIEALDNTMERAQLRLENTLTAMGTIYPQTMLLGAKDIDSTRYKHLQHEIADEVSELEDILVAMDDVYTSK
jgi:predicted XRE-type DNA-binding protein